MTKALTIRTETALTADHDPVERWDAVVGRYLETRKGGREDGTVLRDVYQALMDYLKTRENLKPSSPLFVGVNHRAGKRMSTRTVRRQVDHYLRQAGLKREGISGHSLRHTAITWPILAGASLVQAMELARHADPRTTKSASPHTSPSLFSS